MKTLQPIFILGSGGFAKEVYALLSLVFLESNDNYLFSGFIDKTSDKVRKIGNAEFPIVDESEFLEEASNEGASILIGIGNPQILQSIITRYKKSKYTYIFPNLIHPNAQAFWPTVVLGEGNVITSNTVFTVDITIGSFNIFNLNATVGHDTQIGNYNVINPGVNISGSVVIGDRNLLGTNCAVLQNISIGSDCIIGGGGLLNKNLDSNLVAAGVPAKPFKQNLG